MLSDDEIKKAACYKILKHQQRYIIAHAFLRHLLSYYIDKEPAKIRISHDEFGKPELKTDDNQNQLNFSLSHSSGLVLVSICSNRRTGIDVERIKSGRDFLKIAERFFSDDEIIALRSLNTDQQQNAFYNCWTRKEAYLKAIGMGIRLPISNFSVSLLPNNPAALLSVDSVPDESQRWTLIDIETLPEYIATVAVEGQNQKIVQRQLELRGNCFLERLNS